MKNISLLLLAISLILRVGAQNSEAGKSEKKVKDDLSILIDSLDKIDNSFYLLIKPKPSDNAEINYIIVQDKNSLYLNKFLKKKLVSRKQFTCDAISELLTFYENYDVLTFYLDFKSNNTIAARFIYLGKKAFEIRETYKEIANQNIVDESNPDDKIKAGKLLNALSCIAAAE